MKTTWIRTVGATLALTAIVVGAAQLPGSAQLGPTVHGASIAVSNQSDMCAWITIYKATALSHWAIETMPQSRPRFVAPRGSYTFTAIMPTAMKIPTEIRVRAQMERTGDCSRASREVANLNREIKGLEPRNPAVSIGFDAVIQGSNGRYSLDLRRVSN